MKSTWQIERVRGRASYMQTYNNKQVTAYTHKDLHSLGWYFVKQSRCGEKSKNSHDSMLLPYQSGKGAAYMALLITHKLQHYREMPH